jgi:hypothetical protein
MSHWTPKRLAADGFVGWVRWSACPDALAAIPKTAGGVYVIVRTEPDVEPAYLDQSPAGTFRGDPTVSREALDANWVPGALVVYIGKADHGRLRKRLVEYVDFGRGGKKRHSGGRLIWQLAEAQELLVAWRVLPDVESPLAEESRLIASFRADYGKPPFANDPHRLGR